MESAHCTHCGDEASQRCTACKVVRYCSKECQTADWNWHKLLCNQSASFVDKPESEQEVRRVILLPAGDSKPVFYWMSVKVLTGHKEAKFEEHEIDFVSGMGVPSTDAKSGSITLIGDDASGMGQATRQFVPLVVGHKGHGELLDYSISMMKKESPIDHPPNECIGHLLGAEIAHNFRGPLVFLRMSKVENSSFTFDIEASDFTLALDALAELAQKPTDALKQSDALTTCENEPQTKKVCGVKVNANIPYFEETKVLRTNAVFADGGRLSALSVKLGLPLKTTFPTQTDGRKTEIPSEDSPMLPTAYLHISIDPSSPDFGITPPGMENDTASTVVVSADKSAISVWSVADLCNFIEDVAQPCLMDAKWLSKQDREWAVESVVEMWKQRCKDEAAEDSDEAEEEENDSDDDEDGNEYHDAGGYDDLADVRAKMGQMQMATTDLRTGAGYI